MCFIFTKEMLSGNDQPREATVSDISAYVMNGGARWTTGHGTRKAVTAAAAAGVDEEYGDHFPALILQVGETPSAAAAAREETAKTDG